MDASQDFKSLQEVVQKSLVATTRTANGLANEDLDFQRTANPAVSGQLEDKTERLLKLANQLLKSAGKVTNHPVSTLDDTEDIEIQWKQIVDVIDSLLEKADTCLDEYTGLIKRKDAPAPDSARQSKRLKSGTDRLDYSLKRANILKPQTAFERKTDNYGSGPWKPLLTAKPHATVPLKDSLVTFTEQEYHTVQYKHPYEIEIQNVKYPNHVYETREPQKYLPVEKTSAIWVDTYEGVLEMLEELKKATEIAVDLEHHDFRSYTGLLSLMQVSTREKDWIVDTLVPWRHKLEVLNEVFADPKIVKVLHGAFMDIIWLQRDLGLYIVGLFDTYHASTVLGYSSRSLAFLLQKFADFDADKKYQLADWRIRPLPEEMLYYARSDTHFLLYIYDMVRNELIQQSDRTKPEFDYIEQVVQKSKEVALQRYEHPYHDHETGQGPRGWFNALSKVAVLYDSEQFSVYKAVHQWRDEVARREDESTGFLMPQQVLADIARLLPSDKKALWSILGGNARVLKPYMDELFDLIQKAKAKGTNGPTMAEALRATYGETVGNGNTGKANPIPEMEVLDVKELKSQRSQFWGDVALSSAWDGSTRAAKADEYQVTITVPYPFAGEADDAEPMEVEEGISPMDPATEVEPVVVENDEFTLKSGRKRKLEEANEESEAEDNAGPDDVLAVDSDEEAKKGNAEKLRRQQEKKARKLRKRLKEQKKLEKAKEKEEATSSSGAAEPAAAEEEEDEEEKEDQPFDYSQAESVLHAAKNGTSGADGKHRKKGGKAAFNPYGNKSGGAPGGARATNHVKSGGRTATFK
ncbi:exosome complex exonuclease rrp6 [Rhypophila decipiens]|uniref:Exosome complex exonuclease rrp6 n=1 Tax=Rhypophila decipiens TaxID=261697 RepID=A0AAN7BC64_9PEZI|nr:exosome complex exonuclease rrp6 [Rhypophila decipiens]